ncbi:MAG: family 43 glycosylhydrolase [Opitutales bacterium]|nr:family 43 glycosylhydrolase [Opitutales bacterium]
MKINMKHMVLVFVSALVALSTVTSASEDLDPKNHKEIYVEAFKFWKQKVKVDPTPASDEQVVITVSDTPTLQTPEWKRRDPSDIIRVGDTYYVWYAKIHKSELGFPGGWSANTWYATSKDGVDWQEQGIAIDKGAPGAWDEGGAYTPNILAYKGKYYLAYTGVKAPFNIPHNLASIGMAVSDTPDGPWTKLGDKPMISPTDSYDAPDGFLCDDTVFVVREDKIWLYYKGYPKTIDAEGKDIRVRQRTFLLVAVADQPEGPYVKHGEILHEGHEAVLWTNPDGSVGSFCTSHGPSLYYESTDGINFKSMNPITSQKALGIYRADFEEGNRGARPTWGISAEKNKAGLGLRRIEIKWP